MSNAQYMNSSMQKLFQKKSLLKLSSYKRRHLENIVRCFFSNIILKNVGGQDVFAPYDFENMIMEYENYTLFECSVNELFVPVKRNFPETILWVLSIIEQELENYKGKCFCVVLSVQYGRYSSLNIKIHLLRQGEFFLDETLDHYQQPVMYKLINISN